MMASVQSDIEINLNFREIELIEILEYPNKASEIIFSINSNNLFESSMQIIDFIKNNKISVQMALNLIDIFSEIRVKDISLFVEIYLSIFNELSCPFKPMNKKLATLLFFKGINFKDFKPEITEEEILNLYDKESPLYYIAWDKVDELKSKFPNIDVNNRIDLLTLLDCSIKFGSELCFNYLKNKGAKYSINSERYAVQGGNKNIFSQMLEDGFLFNDMINTALDYHNYEIAEYLKSNLGQVPDSLAQSLYYGNYNIASYLLSNGTDLDRLFVLFYIILIIVE